MARIRLSSESLLSRVPFTKSLRLVFISVFFVPFIIISIFLILFLYNSLLTWERDKVDTSFVQTEHTFNGYLKEIRDFSDRIYVNKQLQSVLQKKYENPQDVYSDYANLSFLEDYLHSYREVISYRIYTRNNTLLDNQFIIRSDSSVLSALWYTRAIIMHGQVFWNYKKDNLSGEYYLSLIRSLWDDNDELLGVLVINLNPQVVLEDLAKLIYETTIFHDNKIVYSSSDYFTNNEKNLLLQNFNKEQGNRDLRRFSIRNENVGVVLEAFSPDNQASLDFVIMYIIPIKQLNKATKDVIFVVSSVLILVFILVYIMLYIFSGYIDNRVFKIQEGITEITHNNFLIPKSIGGKDEFEMIYQNLYNLSQSMNKLINTVYAHKIEKEHITSIQNEMNFKMLSTQINPHFLFNTLETIRMKSLASGTADDKEVAKMLKLLASLLRYNLNVKGQLVPLETELNAIENYLTIQKMRFGDRISYEIENLCGMENLYILPLLIQPLVENSFSHGLEGTVTGGFIHIKINCDLVDNKAILLVEVKDNGCGIPSEKLEEINKQLKYQKESSSIGIINVNSRIKLFYEKGSGMEINSQVGEGTTITLKLISLI